MFDFNEKDFLPEMPELNVNCRDHHHCFEKPHLTVQEEMMRVRETLDRVLKVKEMLECVAKGIKDDNTAFKASFTDSCRHFIESVQAELKLFEESQNAEVISVINHIKQNLNSVVEAYLHELQQNGGLVGIISSDIFVTPEMFGADPTGRQDSTQAIQDAINTRKPVIFKYCSSYKITQTITTPDYTYIDLNGSSIRWGNAKSGLMFNISEVCNITIKNGTICSQTENGSAIDNDFIMQITESEFVCIENVEFLGVASDAIYIGYQYDQFCECYTTGHIRIKNCKFYNCQRNGISLVSGYNVYIEDCYFNTEGIYEPKAGIDIEAESGDEHASLHLDEIHIRNNVFENCAKGINICQFGLTPDGVAFIENNKFIDSAFTVFGKPEEDCQQGLTVHFNNNTFEKMTKVFAIVINNNNVRTPIYLIDNVCTGTSIKNTDFTYYGFITITTSANGDTSPANIGGVHVNGIKFEQGTKYPYQAIVNIRRHPDYTGAVRPMKGITIANVNVPYGESDTGVYIEGGVLDYTASGIERCAIDYKHTAKLINFSQHDLRRYSDAIVPYLNTACTFILNDVPFVEHSLVILDNGTQEITLKTNNEFYVNLQDVYTITNLERGYVKITYYNDGEQTYFIVSQ